MWFPFSFWKKFSFSNPANGYLFGGYNASGTLQNTINKMVFSTEVTSTLSNTLAAAIQDMFAVTSSTKGYSCGGYTGSYVTAVRTLTYSGETTGTLGTSLPATNAAGASIQSSLAGYLCGNGDAETSGIVKILYSNESISTISATVTITQPSYGTGLSGYSHGYGSGGSSVQNIIYKFIFKNESLANISGTIATPFRFGCGVYSRNVGYFVGGSDNTNTKLDAITSVQFSNDTVTLISTVLASATNLLSGCSSITRGYAQGGKTGAPATTNNVYILFSNESMNNAANALSAAKAQGAGTQGG